MSKKCNVDVALFQRCAISTFRYFNVLLFRRLAFSMLHYFDVVLFWCCAFLMLQYRNIKIGQLQNNAMSKFSTLHYFEVALFRICTISTLCYFDLALFRMYFHVALIQCCANLINIENASWNMKKTISWKEKTILKNVKMRAIFVFLNFFLFTFQLTFSCFSSLFSMLR